MSGLAFGAGSEVAHQAVRGVMGHGQGQAQQAQQAQGQGEQGSVDRCQAYLDNFTSCLRMNADSIGTCQPYNDSFRMCKEGTI